MIERWKGKIFTGIKIAKEMDIDSGAGGAQQESMIEVDVAHCLMTSVC